MLAASRLGLLLASESRQDGTMSTSDTELIDRTYIVTPTSTGGPATKRTRSAAGVGRDGAGRGTGRGRARGAVSVTLGDAVYGYE